MVHPAVRASFRQFIRDLICYSLNRHSPGSSPDIALFGSRRSGTTLVMEVLTANRGVKFSDQPLSVFTASPYQLQRLPIGPEGRLMDLEEPVLERLRDYLQDIHAGRLHVNEPWRFWRRSFDFASSRIVLKLTNAHLIADWMTASLDLQTIVLTRHPIAQSLSVIRNGWGLRVSSILASESYRTEFLDDARLALAKDILSGGNQLEQHVLGWTLENLPLIRGLDRHSDWNFVTYEGFVQDPLSIIADWSERLALPDIEAMKTAVRRPSLSTRKSGSAVSASAMRTEDTEAMLSTWRKKIDEETERAAMRILEAFEIDLYRSGDVLPTVGWRPAASRGTS